MINKISQNNIKAKTTDKAALSENKSCKTSCSANVVLNHLHFTGATRFFKKNLVATPDEIEAIMTDRFKDKSNGILGSLPYGLIKELKEVSKDKATMDKNVKEIYNAFKKAPSICKQRIFDEVEQEYLEDIINTALKKAGIKKNLFKFCFKFKEGSFGIPVCFKLGDEEYVLKVMKNGISEDDLIAHQSGKHIESTRSLYLNHFKVKNASSDLPEHRCCIIKNPDTVHYFKYVKLLWGDTKAGYIVTKHEKQDLLKYNPFYTAYDNKLHLKPISELYSGCKCTDIAQINVKNSTIIDPGRVYIKETMDKSQRAEYKKLIKSVFKPSTPDEFLKNIVKHQKDFKNGFWDIEYVSFAMIKAFDKCSKETKRLIKKEAGDELRLCIIKRAESTYSLNSNHFLYLVKNSSENAKNKMNIEMHKSPQKDRLKAFISFLPAKSESDREKLASMVSHLADKDKFIALKFLLPNSSDTIKKILFKTAFPYHFENHENRVNYLREIISYSSPEFKIYMRDFFKLKFKATESLIEEIGLNEEFQIGCRE